jgi:hypothetical protein
MQQQLYIITGQQPQSQQKRSTNTNTTFIIGPIIVVAARSAVASPNIYIMSTIGIGIKI